MRSRLPKADSTELAKCPTSRHGLDGIFLIAGSAGCAGLFYFCTKGIW